MSNLNSAKRAGGGSPNISVAKARQNVDAASVAESEAIQARTRATASSNRFSSSPQDDEVEGMSKPIECRNTKECGAGFACIDGVCTSMDSIGSDRISTPGDCELPEDGLQKNPCGKPGGCDKPTCGEEVGDLDCCGDTVYRGYVTESDGVDEDGKTLYKQVWKEQCEPLTSECDQYADFWFKATGELPNGHTLSDVCSSCNECGAGKVCRPISSSFAPCYCYPGICKNKEGPCFDCLDSTGDCRETCSGCVAKCNEFFTCPCDPSGRTYQAFGSFNPCLSGNAGCYAPTAEYIETYCETNFPCEDREGGECIGDCETIKDENGYPDCPPGGICEELGFIKNEETEETTYFLEVCRLKPDCGCSAPPDSPLYKACGECQICNGRDCAPDPVCGTVLNFPGGGRYTAYYNDWTETVWQCYFCSGKSWLDWNYGIDPCGGSGTTTSIIGDRPGEGPGKSISVYSAGAFSFSMSGSVTTPKPCNVKNQPSVKVKTGSMTYQRTVIVVNAAGIPLRTYLATYQQTFEIYGGYTNLSMENPGVQTRYQAFSGRVDFRPENQYGEVWLESNWPPASPPWLALSLVDQV